MPVTMSRPNPLRIHLGFMSFIKMDPAVMDFIIARFRTAILHPNPLEASSSTSF